MARYDVLIVDDDPATREGLGALLTNAGFTCDMANDGAEAIEKIGSHNLGVVLLDVHLPGISGLDVLARCLAKGSPPKVILMTGVNVADTALNALRGRAHEFLAKPIEPERLIDAVTRALAAPPDVPAIEILSARPEWVELLVPCTREAVERIQSFVQELEGDLPGDLRDSVGLAFRELLLNGIEWGGGLDPAQRIRVACLRTRRMLLYRIADPGRGFSFGDVSQPAVTSAADLIAQDLERAEKGLRPGGFGLVLIRAIADELIYNERQNEVVFVKYLDELSIGKADVEAHRKPA